MLAGIAGCRTPTVPTAPPTAMADISIHLVAERPGKPPLVRLCVDVRIANEGHEPLWVLVPSHVPGRGGVDRIEQHATDGVRIARLLGSGGCHVLAVGPGVTLTVRNLEIGWWSDGQAASPPAIEVRTATDVRLGDEPIATWFALDPIVRQTVDVDAATAQQVHTRSLAREVAIALTNGSTTTVACRPAGANPQGTTDSALAVAEWRTGFPVPKGARADPGRSGATSVAPGRNYAFEAHEIDADFDALVTFFARHLPDARRTTEGQAVKFSRPGGSVEIVRSGTKARFTIWSGPH